MTLWSRRNQQQSRWGPADVRPPSVLFDKTDGGQQEVTCGSAGTGDKELGGRDLRDWERVQPQATRVSLGR